MKLLDQYQLSNSITLQNKMVMAPLTRSRATDNMSNDLMVTYYGQRASAGLIITEGTAPSPNGLGYPRIPGCYTEQQVEGWRKVTKTVHNKGGKIFLQLMHTGRVSHPDNMPKGAEVLAPSAIQLSGQMYTDAKGMQDYPMPRAMNDKDIRATIAEFVNASKKAIEAGFDGVELHGANGYLIDQFINPAANQREDNYGGVVANRNRFAIEVAAAVAKAIGPKKTGMRLSPYGVFNDMKPFDRLEYAYVELAKDLKTLGLVYLHLVDHSSMGAPEVPASLKKQIKEAFGRTIILSGGYDSVRAERDLKDHKGDLIAFGRPFLANPDLPYRIAGNIELNVPDPTTFYTPGPKGYVDYKFARVEVEY